MTATCSVAPIAIELKARSVVRASRMLWPVRVSPTPGGELRGTQDGKPELETAWAVGVRVRQRTSASICRKPGDTSTHLRSRRSGVAKRARPRPATSEDKKPKGAGAVDGLNQDEIF